MQLNGLEVHTYNRSGLYSQLEEKFGLEPGIIPPAVKLCLNFSAWEFIFSQQAQDPGGDKEEAVTDPDLDSTEYVLGKNWRDFIPVIKVRGEQSRNILCNVDRRLIFPPASLSSATDWCRPAC